MMLLLAPISICLGVALYIADDSVSLTNAHYAYMWLALLMLLLALNTKYHQRIIDVILRITHAQPLQSSQHEQQASSTIQPFPRAQYALHHLYQYQSKLSHLLYAYHQKCVQIDTGYAKIFIYIISLFLLGYQAAHYRSVSANAPILQHRIHTTNISGQIVDIDVRDKDSRLYLQKLTIEGITHNETPHMVRINTKYRGRHSLRIGSFISAKATLIPPSMPSYPNGFDTARLYYFKRIGATGYTTSKIKTLTSGDKEFALLSNAKRYIRTLRHNISSRIKSGIGNKNHAIASAILVGISSEIQETDAEYLRQSGTAHIIAISGMHVASVATIVFLLLQIVFKRTRLKVSHDLSKISAILSILAILIYLIIAGAPVSAQRAAATSILFFLAIILDRDYSSIRAIAIAGTLIILCNPELIFSPSLQMSFAASASLITSFKILNSHLQKIINNGQNKLQKLSRRIFVYVISLFSASAVASFATAPFIAYHFHKLSLYSILANLICVPVTEALVMPAGVLSLICMPFHLETIPLKLMELGINIILYISKLISLIPYASLEIPTIPAINLALLSATLYFAVILNNARKQILCCSAFILLFLYSVIRNHEVPAIILSESGKIFAVNSNIICSAPPHNSENAFLIPSSKQHERYTLKTWRQGFGYKNFAPHSLTNMKIDSCSSSMCHLCFDSNARGAINARTENILIILDDEDNVLLSINKNDLRTSGTHVVYLSPKSEAAPEITFKVQKVSDFLQKERNWHKHLFLKSS